MSTRPPHSAGPVYARLAQARRTVAWCAAVLVSIFGWQPTSYASSTEYALLPALKTDLALQGLLLDVAHDGKRLLAAGEQGHILFSDDDGRSWVHADVPVSLAITSVAFAGPNRAWATAHDGYLLHSTDNGATWQVKFSGSDVARLSVGAIEERVAKLEAAVTAATPDAREELEWILDDALLALDETKEAIDDGMTSPLLNVWFANDLDGYALGAYGVFLRTRDGGDTWVVDGNRLDNPDKYHLYDITQSVAGTLLVVGEAGTLLRSLDNGDEWLRVDAPYEGSYFGAVAAGDGGLLIFGLRGNVFRSTDEGASWTAIDTGDRRTLMCGSADDDNSIYLAGAAGAVLWSNDGGASFVIVPTEGNTVYSGITATPDGRVLLAGFGGIYVAQGISDE